MAFDYVTGGLLGPFTVQSPATLLRDAGPAGFAPRAFSNSWRLIANPRTKFGFGNLINEARLGREGFKAVSKQYWRASSGAQGKALHHIWIQQQTQLPAWLEPLRNSGLNLLEIGGPLNSWMGGQLLRETGFRLAVVGALATVGYGSYSATSDLLYGAPADSPWSAEGTGDVGDTSPAAGPLVPGESNAAHQGSVTTVDKAGNK
jgi:hypothetical protein